MQEDINRWNRKYRERALERAGGTAPVFPPHEPLLERVATRLDGGDVLDVACGLGQNAMWLAARGHRVVGVDGSEVALRMAARESARRALPVRWLCADLEYFTPAVDSVDLIVVVRFLDRTGLPRLLRALRPGGLLFHLTFNVNRLAEDPRFNRHYLLERGELRRLLDALEVLDGNDTDDIEDASTWLLARRRA